MVVQEVLWANYFGRFSLGLVRSTGFPIVFAFSAAGPIFMNGIFDLVGSYKPAYLMFIGFYAVAAFLLWIVVKRYATPEELGCARLRFPKGNALLRLPEVVVHRPYDWRLSRLAASRVRASGQVSFARIGMTSGPLYCHR